MRFLNSKDFFLFMENRKYKTVRNFNIYSHGSKYIQATDSSFYLKNFISVEQFYKMANY